MSDYGIRVTYGALPAAIRKARRDPAIVNRARREAITAAGPFLQSKLARATPEGATGLAGQNVVFDIGPGPVGHVGYAEPAAGYMPNVEYGTSPHWPPRAAMELYAARKFGYPTGSREARRAGYLIARKISRVGTKGQHVVENTATTNRAAAQRLMAAAAIGVFRRMGTGR